MSVIQTLLRNVLAMTCEKGFYTTSDEVDVCDMLDVPDVFVDDIEGDRSQITQHELSEDANLISKNIKNMAAKSGTILDALEHAKAKFPNDSEMQGKYLLVCLDLIKRDYGEHVQTIQAPYQHYNAILTAFPSDGMAWCVWELYSGAMQAAVGLERLNPNTNEDSLLFSSSPAIDQPILSKIMI